SSFILHPSSFTIGGPSREPNRWRRLPGDDRPSRLNCHHPGSPGKPAGGDDHARGPTSERPALPLATTPPTTARRAAPRAVARLSRTAPGPGAGDQLAHAAQPAPGGPPAARPDRGFRLGRPHAPAPRRHPRRAGLPSRLAPGSRLREPGRAGPGRDGRRLQGPTAPHQPLTSPPQYHTRRAPHAPAP